MWGNETITCDQDESDQYFGSVRRYYADQVLGDSGCTCRHLDVCRTSASPNEFAAAQLSLVGRNYAMRRDGRPWRIAVVSMQNGTTDSPITMEHRREQFRLREKQTFAERNAHIKGTTSALRVLWGRAAGTDEAGEFVAAGREQIHVLSAMALVNATLCSSVPEPGIMLGAGSDLMHKRCTDHLRAVLELLKPTILHSQGRRKDPRYPTPHRSLLAVLEDVRWQDDHVALARIGEHELVWNAVGHPSAKGKVAWQHPESPYFVETIQPSLARRESWQSSGSTDRARPNSC